MEIIFLLIGLAAGITLGYLLASRKVSALQTQMKLQQKHVEELQQVEKQMWQEKLNYAVSSIWNLKTSPTKYSSRRQNHSIN